jgi:superfamily II DNA or RNA helicase
LAKKITLTILDHVNCHFDGLTEGQIKHIIDKTSIVDPTLYHSVGYKLGHIDAKVSYFDEEGFSFVYSIDEVLNILERDFKINDIDIVDERDFSIIPDNLSIEEDFLIEETGYNLRPHQVNVVNSALREKFGTIDASTSAGKTLICLAISKKLDPYIKTVIIVPSEQLLNQTFEDYKKSSLSVGKLHSKIAPKDREKFINDHRHIIVTSKLFVNCKDIFSSNIFALIQDENQVSGEVLMNVFRFDVPQYPMKLGLTGSFPYTNKLKARMINNHLGGGVIAVVEPKELVDKGFVSTVDISTVKTVDLEVEELFQEIDTQRKYEWSIEQNYLLGNKNRIKAIGDWLHGLPKKNTLVLCHAQFGNELSKYMGLPFIDKDTSVTERSNSFSKFGITDDHIQLASFGTSATGISENDIFVVVMIDVGKNRTAILQSIGRGMRKSDKQDHVDIVDIYANLKYSKRHYSTRTALYKEKHYPHKDIGYKIIVKGD